MALPISVTNGRSLRMMLCRVYLSIHLSSVVAGLLRLSMNASAILSPVLPEALSAQLPTIFAFTVVVWLSRGHSQGYRWSILGSKAISTKAQRGAEVPCSLCRSLEETYGSLKFSWLTSVLDSLPKTGMVRLVRLCVMPKCDKVWWFRIFCIRSIPFGIWYLKVLTNIFSKQPPIRL